MYARWLINILIVCVLSFWSKIIQDFGPKLLKCIICVCLGGALFIIAKHQLIQTTHLEGHCIYVHAHYYASFKFNHVYQGYSSSQIQDETNLAGYFGDR